MGLSALESLGRTRGIIHIDTGTREKRKRGDITPIHVQTNPGHMRGKDDKYSSWLFIEHWRILNRV
jgi:hypothetical protein